MCYLKGADKLRGAPLLSPTHKSRFSHDAAHSIIRIDQNEDIAILFSTLSYFDCLSKKRKKSLDELNKLRIQFLFKVISDKAYFSMNFFSIRNIFLSNSQTIMKHVDLVSFFRYFYVGTCSIRGPVIDQNAHVL